MKTILFLEDDKILAETIIDLLSVENFKVIHVKDADSVLEATYKSSFDLYLFDVNVPNMNGFELLKLLRDSKDKTPTIFLTALSDIASLAKGFDVGADDYIKKPFDFDELLIRINAILKKYYDSVDSKISVNNYTFDFDKNELYKDDTFIPLSTYELKLSELFFKNLNKTLNKEFLIDELSYNKEISSGSLRVYINKLRKVGLPIDTIKGVGYRLSSSWKNSFFEVLENEFVKYIPSREKNIYLQVFKSKKSFQQKAKKLKIKIIFTQLFLLLIFAFISYFLAKNALKPLNDSIDTLDKFAKDLIYDLNTPVTAMQLNMKILEKNGICVENKAFHRLKKSVESILELHISLKTLLENKTFQLRKINLCNLINDVVELHQINYKNLNFIVKCTNFEVNANEHAIKQILHNLISNACKYNRDNGYIKIYTKDNTLYIEDSGIGIKNPELIFNREYSTQNSSGLGLDIVKRLCDAWEY